MTNDDAFEFRPRPGRGRDRGARAGARSQSFVAQVMRAATRANGRPLTLAQMRGKRRRGSARTRPRKGRCSRIGRGQAVADRLKRMAGERRPDARMRRVVIKARIVRLKVVAGRPTPMSGTCNARGRPGTTSAGGSTAPRPTRRTGRTSRSVAARTATSSASSSPRRMAIGFPTCAPSRAT
jgi:hypothetical protein